MTTGRPCAARDLRALCLLLVAGGACTAEPPTAIIIEVDTDLAVPGEIDRIAFRVTAEGRSVVNKVQEIGPRAGQVQLPLRLAVERNGPAPLAVEVVGRLGEKDVLTRSASLEFATGKVMVWRGYLDRPCVGIVCATGQTCDAGAGCIPFDRAVLDDGRQGQGVWTRRATDCPCYGWPERSVNSIAAYDRSRKRVVCLGEVPSGSPVQAPGQALFEWNGTAGSWDQVSRTLYSPSPTPDAIVFDETRQRLTGVAWDGLLEWDEATRTWRRLLRIDVGDLLGIAYDRARGVLVYASSSGLHEWNSTTRSLETYSLGGALGRILGGGRRDGELEYDAALKKVVGWSGIDAWSWDPTAREWQWLGVDHWGGPAAIGGVTFDALSQRWIAFGGLLSPWGSNGPNDVTYSADTWAWDSLRNAWSYRTAPRQPRPAARAGQGMVFDEARGRLVLFGGRGAGTGDAFTDTWEWDPGSRGGGLASNDSSGMSTARTGGGAAACGPLWGGGAPSTGGTVGADAAPGASTMTCGAPGQPCCAANTCSGGGCCVQGQCRAHGMTCGRGVLGICANGSCRNVRGQVCGAAGQPCCVERGVGGIMSPPSCTAAGQYCVKDVCLACGELGQPCCGGGCAMGLQCGQAGTCLRCGAMGQECCPGSQCQSGLGCSCPQRPPGPSPTPTMPMPAPPCAPKFPLGTCMSCGAVNEPCCDGGGCQPGGQCVRSSGGAGGTCQPCGKAGQPCCAGADGLGCESGGNCVVSSVDRGGTCQPCGKAGQPCCDGGDGDNYCSTGFWCTGLQAGRQTCVACGTEGQRCCAISEGSRACQDGLACSGGPRVSPAPPTCEKCGAVGAPCCPGASCQAGGLCRGAVMGREGGTCEPCGGAGQPCCVAFACVVSSTSGCGPFSHGDCSTGFVCTSESQHNPVGICAACGAAGQPCCRGLAGALTCQQGLACRGGCGDTPDTCEK